MLRVIAIVLAGLAVSVPPAAAESHSQLALTVKNGLVQYGYHLDTASMDRALLSQLHLTMSGRGDYQEKKRKLQTILEKAGLDG